MKEVVFLVKLQIPAGQANPAPPIGTALGPKGINIMEFCKQFNAQTQDKSGDIVSVVISIFKDKSFKFIVKNSPTPRLVLKAAGIKSGAKAPGRDAVVGKITKSKVMEIAKIKMDEMGAGSIEAAVSMVEGTARSMGISVVEG